MSSELFVGPDAQPDKYRLVRSVGHGGEATLYLAEVTLAGGTEPVVVKVLDSEVAGTPEQFAELSHRWNEQAELLRFINRLGVVGVREHFEGAPEHPRGGAGRGAERCLYLVMNYVEGLDLRDWRAENPVDGPRAQREVLGYLEQVAEILDLLHSGRATPSKRVVVHGDLSPGNIMISTEGQATLVDFGLSRIAARHMTAKPWFTPGYAAPEIFTGEYTAATDRYAFGAIVFFALTGEEPPPSPEQLRAAYAGLPVLAGAGPQQRDKVMAMFSADPAARPMSLDWIRTLRSLSTSVQWSMPVGNPAGGGFPAVGPAPLSASGHGATEPMSGPVGEPSAGPGPGPAAAHAYAAPGPAAPGAPTVPAGRPPAGAASGAPAAPAADAGTVPARTPRKRRTALIAVAAAVALLATAGGAAAFVLSGDGADVTAAADDPEPGGEADPSVPDNEGGSAESGEGKGDDDAQDADAADEAGDEEEGRTVNDTPGAPLSGSAQILPAAGYESGSATLGDVTYAESLKVSGECAKPSAEYNLARGSADLRSTVGLTGGSGSATFSVVGDGERLFSETVSAGDTADVDVSVQGVMRLRLTVDWGGSCPSGGTAAVWGDPKLT
ncbi:NPCBM/NEW2 domain-containing protein [Nocardiopsis mangrovi]|uniref:non-specific serine/threonine protein kinase n=1 Tax=Nocardiopsis mangrovi TaxID=1179818 RepID=A0ABV9DZR1_9ACTN